MKRHIRFYPREAASTHSVGPDDEVIIPEALRVSITQRGSIIKTLGTEGDFTSLADFFFWIHTTSFSGADITLNIAAGTYDIDEVVALNVPGVQSLTFSGASKATVTIRITVGGIVPTLVAEGFNFTANDITFEASSADSSILIQGANGGFYDCDINDFVIAAIGNRGLLVIHGCQITSTSTIPVGQIRPAAGGIVLIESSSVIDAVPIAIELLSDGAVEVDTSTISNCDLGVKCAYPLARAVLTSVTLTSNTTDFSIPVNEIQYNGSYISNNTAALSFKA